MIRAPATAGSSESMAPFWNTSRDGSPAVSGPACSASCSRLSAALLAAARAAASADRRRRQDDLGGSTEIRAQPGTAGTAVPCSAACGVAIADAGSGASAGDATAGVSGTSVIVTGCGDS